MPGPSFPLVRSRSHSGSESDSDFGSDSCCASIIPRSDLSGDASSDECMEDGGDCESEMASISGSQMVDFNSLEGTLDNIL